MAAAGFVGSNPNFVDRMQEESQASCDISQVSSDFDDIEGI